MIFFLYFLRGRPLPMMAPPEWCSPGQVPHRFWVGFCRFLLSNYLRYWSGWNCRNTFAFCYLFTSFHNADQCRCVAGERQGRGHKDGARKRSHHERPRNNALSPCFLCRRMCTPAPHTGSTSAASLPRAGRANGASIGITA